MIVVKIARELTIDVIPPAFVHVGLCVFKQYSRGGSRISGKGVHMYKCVCSGRGVGEFPSLILSHFFKYPMEMPLNCIDWSIQLFITLVSLCYDSVCRYIFFNSSKIIILKHM